MDSALFFAQNVLLLFPDGEVVTIVYHVLVCKLASIFKLSWGLAQKVDLGLSSLKTTLIVWGNAMGQARLTCEKLERDFEQII